MTPLVPEFLTDPIIRDVSEGFDTQRLQFLGDFVWRSAVLGFVARVPKDFIFEESIPQILLGVVRQYGFSKRAAGAHDWGYQKAHYQPAVWNEDLWRWEPVGEPVPAKRSVADKVYLELAVLKGLPRWRARLRYRVLRLTGWVAWRKHRRLAKQA